MHIPKPCNEDWDAMRIGLISRHCEQCSKDVMDFTKMDRIEILKYLILNYENKTCGRVYPSQLDYTHDELMIVIKDIQLKSKNRNLVFYFLTIGTLLISSCNEKTAVSHQIEKIHDTVLESKKSGIVSVSLSNVKIDSFPPVTIKGDISCGPIDSTHAKISEVMPEFPGGEDSLMAFIQQNLLYPEYEKANAISGRIVVSFIVKKDGSIRDVKIVKSVTGSKNFDYEVLRIIKKMPNWIPGSNNGKKVDIEFFLPITFEL